MTSPKRLAWAMDTEHSRGLWTLCKGAAAVNMQQHQPKGSAPGGKFYLYISNALNSTAGMNVVHNALYSRNYAKYAERAGGINYAVYYTDYEGMTADDRGAARFEVDGGRGATVYNYRSNFGWVDLPGVRAVERSSEQEFILFHCHAMGLKCAAL
eukprot:gene37922-45394_t